MFQPFRLSDRAAKAKEQYQLIIINAFRVGISVMEMTRVTGNDAPDFFYAVLRNAGSIPPMKRGRSRVYVLPDFMDKIFEKKVSFAKWCHLWDFNPDSTLPALNNKMPDPNTDQYMYHWALRRDFPYLYEENYPASPARNIRPLTMTRGLVRSLDKCEVRINKSVDKGFVASIIDEDIHGEGDSWSEALRDLEYLWRIHRGIIRLNHTIKGLYLDE